MRRSNLVLAVIIISQFCCTSLWFAGNGIMDNLVSNFNLDDSALGHLTSAVQFGFIIGTLVFAILTIGDRYSPSKVFFTCALLGAACNTAILMGDQNLLSLFSLRLLTGFFLAGIYPIGMKIAADYFEEGLGRSLGFLVGALVVGTAFPHLLNGLPILISWENILITTSLLAVFGGTLLLILVPDGPYRKPGQQLNLSAFYRVFSNKKFRSAAFGYFGHMWELYAFWTFVPVMLKAYYEMNELPNANISGYSFAIIAIGGPSCVAGGYLSQRLGVKKVAFTALLLSCICCLLSPFIFQVDSILLMLCFLLFWGVVVIADSPLFSTLVAHNAPAEIKGTALTIVNCIGFAITIVSIQLLTSLQSTLDTHFLFIVLAIGPIFGLFALRRK